MPARSPKAQSPKTLIRESGDDLERRLDEMAVKAGRANPVLYEEPMELVEDAAEPIGYKGIRNNLLDAVPPSTGYPLLFTGVMHCRYEAIKCLFDKKFGTNFRLLGVDVLLDRWYVYVPTLGNAAEIILRMDKMTFHGGVLSVRYLHPNGQLLNARQVNRLLEQHNYNANVMIARCNNGFTEFSAAQLRVFNDVFETFHKLPYHYKDGVPVEQMLRASRRTQSKAPNVVRMALKEHGPMLVGVCIKNKYVHDGWLKLVPTRSINFEERRLCEQSQHRPHEPWEPFGMDAVDRAKDFVQYMKAMLTRFGPMCIYTHLRLRLATFIGQGQFQSPATARELIYFLERSSPSFVVCDDTIYDITLPSHRKILKENMTGALARSERFTMSAFMEHYKDHVDF